MCAQPIPPRLITQKAVTPDTHNMRSVLLSLCIVLFLAVNATFAAGQSKNIVILAPHPDDEALCCAGVIYSALQRGDNVTIVVMTNGDYNSGVSLGLQREGETVSAMSRLGVPEAKIIFLGYGDQSLQDLYQSTSPGTVIVSPAGLTQTYATRGLGGVSYHQYLHGTPGPYSRQTLLGDVESMLQNVNPTDVYTTGLWDDHTDHVSTFNFLLEAILGLRRQGVPLSVRVHETLIHAPCQSCGTPSNSNYIWPGGGVGITPTFSPNQPFPEPYYLENVWPNGTNTPYSWKSVESVPLPQPMLDPNQATNLKAAVISNYASQDGSDRNAFLYAFVKRNEFFWLHDFNSNIAGLAAVTVSSENSSTGQVGASAVDGFIEGYPGNQSWEWVTQGQLEGAWINLAWPTSVTISQVVLYNRQTQVEEILSGHLTFSDGSTVPVGQVPMNGNGYLVSFPPKTVTSMRFTVDSATGQAIGLTEIEVYGTPAGTALNEPYLFQGIVASAPYNTDIYGQNLTPTITDAQSTSLNVVAFDVNAQPLTYAWDSDSGVIAGAGPTASFSPPVVASPTLVSTRVVVSDGSGGTAQTSGLITVTPSNSSGIAVSSIALNPAIVASGSSTMGTVTLNSVAAQGAVVALSSNNTAVAAVPATLNIPPGASSASFSVSTSFVSADVSVNISASLGGVTMSAALNVLRPPAYISSLTFNPPTVGGGNSATGTIALTAPAQGNAIVLLTNGVPSIATVPASVTILSGQTSTTFPVTTQPVAAAAGVGISANFVGQTSSAILRVAPYVAPNLATSATVSVSSQSVSTQQQGTKAIDGLVDGSPGDYTREWATVGQLAGAWLRLTWSIPVTTGQVVLYDRPNFTDNVTSATLSFSDGSSVPVGALPNDGSALTVTFPNRTVTWMQFTVGTAVGQNIGLAEIAVVGTVAQASAISSLSVDPSSVTGGIASTGTVTLNGVAPPGGTMVTLSSSNSSIASVPPAVMVPSGSLTASFPITTYSVAATTQISISATYNGVQSGSLAVVPVGISSITLTPSMVQGGVTNSAGVVSLSGPAPSTGALISLTSSNPSAATIPVSITIAPGSTTGNFTVITGSVAAAAQASISAVYNGTQTAILLVTPVFTGGAMQQFAVDTFNRTNGPLGSNWTTTTDSPSVPSLVGQQVQSPWVYSTALYYGGISWPADQYAQAQVVQSNSGSTGPAVRMTSSSYYAGTVGSFGSGNASVYIILDRGGNRSILAQSTAVTVLANDYLQLTALGTTLTLTNVTQSQTLLTVSDSTLPAGYPGLYVGSGGIAANWSAGLEAMPPDLLTVASDNFNRPDAPNLGPNWSVAPGYLPIQIVNTQIEPQGGHGKEYYTSAGFSSDQWSQAQVIGSSNDVNGAMVRYQGTSDTHYVGFVSVLGAPGSCSVSIDRDINGAPAVLATDNHYCSVSSGDYVRLQVMGPLLTYVDVTTGTLLLSVLDSGISGGSPGWSLSPNGGMPIAANWSGGQYVGQSQATLSSVTLSQQSVPGGSTLTGTVLLNGPAPTGGATVALVSSNVTAAQIPGAVIIPAGSTSATFTITTSSVSSDTALTITATYGTESTAVLTVSAAIASVSSLTVAPATVVGGTPATGTVTLSIPAPAGGVTIAIATTNTAVAQVPATLTVGAGQTTATFPVTTSPVSSDTVLGVSGSLGVTQTASLRVTAPVPSSLTLNPVAVSGGSSSTATVTLNGPAPSGGLAVTLSSSNTSVAQVPSSITVASGTTSATFSVSSSAVTADTTVSISATSGSTQSATLSVTAPRYSITGQISGPGGPGATVTLTGLSTATVTSDASGNFSFAGLANGAYTVAPANGSYAFSPPSRGVTINGSNISALNFSSVSISSIVVSPSSVIGGNSVVGTITLTAGAPSNGAMVALSSSNAVAAQVPASVIVPAGQTTATFNITSHPVDAATPITISAALGATVSATFTISAPTLASLSVSPASVVGGSSATCTVTLNGAAPSAGALITLSSSNTGAAPVPASVAVAAGAVTATFTITTAPVATNTTATISGFYGVSRTASLAVMAPTLTGNGNAITISPSTVIGGTSSTGTVRLTGPAPAAGATVTLSSSNTAAAQVPATILVAPNATSAVFTITTTPVASNRSVTITAVYGVTRTASLSVTAATLSTVSLNPVSLIGGALSTGTVTLSGAAPAGGATVTLSSSNRSAATVPSSVTVPANATTATFSVTSNPVATNTNVTITATRGTSSTAILTVQTPVVSALSVNPATVRGGTRSTGTVTISGRAPSGGAVVTLSSSNTGVATVPSSVTVSSGNTSATFTVTSRTVTVTSSATITATRGVSQVAILTVTP